MEYGDAATTALGEEVPIDEPASGRTPGQAPIRRWQGPAGDPLVALLGVPRTLILQRLDRPMTAGGVAQALAFGPSAASHHITVLERAGLIHRKREGRRIVIYRTARGARLLALYEDP